MWPPLGGATVSRLFLAESLLGFSARWLTGLRSNRKMLRASRGTLQPSQDTRRFALVSMNREGRPAYHSRRAC
jgi:hypothetical protein